MSVRIINTLAIAATLAFMTSALGQDKREKSGASEDKPSTSSPSADETAVRGALKTLAKSLQDGDRDQIRKVICATNPTEQKMVDAMASMAAELAHLNKEATKAFGEKEAQALTGDLTAEITRIVQAKVSVDGDTATVVYKPGDSTPKQTDLATSDPAAPLQLTKIDGRWQIPMAKLSKGATAEQIEQRLSDVEVQKKVIADVTAEITQGTYKNVDAVAEAWQAKVMQALTPPRKPPDKKADEKKTDEKKADGK
jgi:hypothetical protein